MTRKIIHIDMDAFYASVEQRDFPELRGRPVIVGGEAGKRGVVAACSYEARAYGVRSAMPAAAAKRLCPQAIFLPPRFDAYRTISQQIRAIMQSATPLVEPLSLDEAYLDVTGSTQAQGSATLIAEQLRAEIRSAVGLTASAGVSYCKMLAKIASDLNKPNGIAVILPDEALDFIARLPIEKIHSIGPATAKKMHALGIRTGAQLRAFDRQLLMKHFGKTGAFYHDAAHGIDDRPVVPHRERKSIGSESTFPQDLIHRADILQALYEHSQEVFAEMAKRRLEARTLTIKLKYADFSQITRSHSVTPCYPNAEIAERWIKRLLDTVPEGQAVRLAGVSCSGFVEWRSLRQLTLW